MASIVTRRGFLATTTQATAVALVPVVIDVREYRKPFTVPEIA